MRILVLGGTQFIGRHVVAALLVAGHAVTVLNRGLSPDALPAAAERLRGDRDAGAVGLAALAGRGWDACIDISGYTPVQVQASVQALQRRVDAYLYVSAVMAYGDAQLRPVRETHPRLPPAAAGVREVDGSTYGPLKVACENLVVAHFPGRCALLRPQVVVGAHDPTPRLAYWVRRAAADGEMLAPGDGSDMLQFIDVRDVARFAVHCVETGQRGAFNLAGPRLRWDDFLRRLGATRPVWVPAEVLQGADLAFGELPLWRPLHGRFAGLMDVSAERALAGGLQLTAIADTLHDARGWARGQDVADTLSSDRERQLMACARGHAA